jgi:OOP family OmpA-OmpF porin
MKPDALVIGVVVAVLAAAVVLAVWLQKDDQLERPPVQELAGPRTPPAPAAAPEPVTTTVLFEFDRAVLRDAEGDKLERLLAGPRAKALRIDAVGHADRIGPAAYNLRLSQRRADAVKSYLLKKKEIGPAAVRTSARGELEPASGDACVGMGAEIRRNLDLVECLQPDRRVEVSIDREK